MKGLGKILPIAINTFRETVRDRVMYAFVLFALLITLAGIVLGSLSVAQDKRIIEDLGIFSITTIGGVIAIFVGTNLVYKEIDKRTIYLIFTKPVSRWQFVTGKFLGLALCIFVVTGLMGAFLYLVLLWQSSSEPVSLMRLFECLGLVYVELLFVIAAATFFSTFSTPLMSVLFTMALWLIAHCGQSLSMLAKMSSSDSVKQVFQAIYNILPDLAVLTQMRADVLDNRFSQPELLAVVLVYLAVYIIMLLLCGTIIAERREFT